MIRGGTRAGEIAVIGLGKSGRAVATLLAREGASVYASDAADTPAVGAIASRLREGGVIAQTGGHDLERIARAVLVVVSPGVPPQAAAIAAARAAGVPVVGEIEVALHALPHTRSIAVTGTNGKTTTTALIGHLLRALDLDAVDAGNIGTPLSDVALAPEHPAWIALELSSFQLHDTPSIAPNVGVVTNLTPDHLDRYGSVDEYYADKALIFRNSRPESKWVLNADQKEVTTLASRLPALEGGKRQTVEGDVGQFTIRDHGASAYFDRSSEMLVVLDTFRFPRSDLMLFGEHNVANALAATLAVMMVDTAHTTAEARDRLAVGLRSFRALKHRLEVAGEFGGVLWINDSKATNVSSTLVAIEGMTRPTVLLLGGRHKGEPYTALADPLRRVAKRVIAYGEAAPLVAADLSDVVPLDRLQSSFAEVMAHARAVAEPGDVVLLSPACSSYDMFNNYEERGAEFKRLAAAPE